MSPFFKDDYSVLIFIVGNRVFFLWGCFYLIPYREISPRVIFSVYNGIHQGYISLAMGIDVRARQYVLADARDEKINHYCVMCLCGFPRGTRIGTEHHEIISKAKLRGESNIYKLYALPNIARACNYHHHHFQYLPVIWMRCMVKLGLAVVSDYESDPNWESFYPPFDCIGDFGRGNDYYKDGVPSTIVMGISGSGNSTSDFCGKICPTWETCIREARKKFLSNT